MTKYIHQIIVYIVVLFTEKTNSSEERIKSIIPKNDIQTVDSKPNKTNKREQFLKSRVIDDLINRNIKDNFQREQVVLNGSEITNINVILK